MMCNYVRESIPFDDLVAGVFEHERRGDKPLGSPIVVHFRGRHGDDFRQGNFAGFSKWEGKYEFCVWCNEGDWPVFFRVFTKNVISVHYQVDYRGAKA